MIQIEASMMEVMETTDTLHVSIRVFHGSVHARCRFTFVTVGLVIRIATRFASFDVMHYTFVLEAFLLYKFDSMESFRKHCMHSFLLVARHKRLPQSRFLCQTVSAQ